jgi:hypothetical protein
VKSSKPILPNYVGGDFQATFPVTTSYARSMLLLHKPWHKHFPYSKADNTTTLKAFYALLNSNTCPIHLKLHYEREKLREEQGHKFSEPTTNQEITELTSGDSETDFIVNAGKLLPHDAKKDMETLGIEYDTGENHDWSSHVYNHPTLSDFEISKWFEDNVWEDDQYSSDGRSNNVGTTIVDEADTCNAEQKQIIGFVLNALKERSEATNRKQYKTTCLTVMGKAGSGKSYVTRNLNILMKKLYGMEEAITTCAPMGCAAFNADGVTLHCFFEFSQSISDIGELDGEKKKVNQEALLYTMFNL